MKKLPSIKAISKRASISAAKTSIKAVKAIAATSSYTTSFTIRKFTTSLSAYMLEPRPLDDTTTNNTNSNKTNITNNVNDINNNNNTINTLSCIPGAFPSEISNNLSFLSSPSSDTTFISNKSKWNKLSSIKKTTGAFTIFSHTYFSYHKSKNTKINTPNTNTNTNIENVNKRFPLDYTSKYLYQRVKSQTIRSYSTQSNQPSQSNNQSNIQSKPSATSTSTSTATTTNKNTDKTTKSHKWWIVFIPVLGFWYYTSNKPQKTSNVDNTNTVDEKPIHPAGPWKVFFYSTLPLKAISRIWGQFNSITLPEWIRPAAFTIYSYVFGVNLDEISDPNLKHYKNLADFFYRELKAGVRPIDPNSDLVSPADGTVLHLGIINGSQIEQVKGMTYSVDALLGLSTDSLVTEDSNSNSDSSSYFHFPMAVREAPTHEINDFSHDPMDVEIIQRHKDFAVVNGIPYTVDDLIGSVSKAGAANTSGYASKEKVIQEGDRTASDENLSGKTSATVAFDFLTAPKKKENDDRQLFFTVIYLAPGDYHRFHSPANWVACARRHFTGELFSVSPFIAKRLPNLFVLNERVALLGKWKYGFFSMTPVGATNVGSIRINFDKDLRTNTKWEYEYNETDNDDVSISSSADNISISSSNSNNTTYSSRRKTRKNVIHEATYKAASKTLGGYPLVKGSEMGGFNLGSTIVLIFEAPKEFKFCVRGGDKVKVGEALGFIKS